MSSITKEIDVDGEWYEVEISYQIVGKYYPATRTDPAEYPEAEWTLEKATDAEGNEVTDKASLQAIEAELDRLGIAAECEENECEALEQSRADAKWDEYR